MPEVRVSHLLIVGVILVIIATPILIFVGWLAIPSFDLFGWKTPDLNQQTMNKGIDTGLAAAAGFNPAKSPTEAMDKFREAIKGRKYKFAALYVNKEYAEQLNRSHDNAAEFGGLVDKIRNWGDNHGILSDKAKIALFQIDPFPTTFKAGPAPKQDGDKAYGNYLWELPKLDNPNTNILEDVRTSMDPRMFMTVLSPPVFKGKLEFVKSGEEWKLNVPMTPAWETEIGYFNDKTKTYVTALNGFWSDINRNQFESKAKFESELFAKLRESK